MVLVQAIVYFFLSAPAELAEHSTVKDRVGRPRGAVEDRRVEEMEVGSRDDRFGQFLRPYVVGCPADSFRASYCHGIAAGRGSRSTEDNTVSRYACEMLWW